MEHRIEIISETDRSVHGKLFGKEKGDADFVFMTDFSQSKVDLWFTGGAVDCLEKIGIVTDPKQAAPVANLFEGELGGYYYLAMASEGETNEALKWLAGSLKATINDRKFDATALSTLMPADYLRTFAEYLVAGRFDRTFAKDIFAALIDAPRHTAQDPVPTYEWVCGNRRGNVADLSWDDLDAMADVTFHLGSEPSMARRTGPEVLDAIIAEPRFKTLDMDELDGIIESVIEANPQQAAKVAEQPKLVQFFIGQTMKASKGKASAPLVQAKIMARFGL